MFMLLNSKIMLRTVARLSPSFIFPLFSNRNQNDHDILLRADRDVPRTGFDRVKMMYMRNEFDEVSIELHNVVQMSMCGVFFGACMGGFVKSKDAFVNFIDNNQATIFNSTMEAKKKLQNNVTVAFAKGAYYWGWRLGIFSGIFSLITTTISVYRDDSSIVDYVTAGAITGAIYKANLGGAAMLVGAGLGAVLSLAGGLLILGVLKVTGRNMAEIRASLYKIKVAREEQFNEVLEKASTDKNDDLTRYHDLIVSEKGEKKINDIS